MQQKVRRKSSKTKSRKTSCAGIPEIDRSGISPALQSHHHSKTEHSESKDACRKRKSGKSIEESGTAAEQQRNPITILFLFLINIYRNCISPWFPPCCRFEPTCSGYAVAALKTHGPFKGSLLILWRILRCNPFCKGGYDPVPPKGAWRPQNSVKENHREI